MKKHLNFKRLFHHFFLLLLLTLANLTVYSQNKWKLVWNDEFDKSSVDTTKWSFQFGNGAPELPGWGNNELQFYQPQNASVSNGILTISAKKEAFGGFSYTSARMRTINKGDWKFGKIVARIKLPKGKGMWPAFWMMPTDNIYGGWPQSGEIDIMEFHGDNIQKVYGTCHYGPPWPKNLNKGDSVTIPAGNFSETFHDFSLEWKKDTLQWFVDNRQYFIVTKKDIASSNWPFNEKFHIILNCAVGGNWPGNPDSSTTFPQTMQVDYVRVYAKE